MPEDHRPPGKPVPDLARPARELPHVNDLVALCLSRMESEGEDALEQLCAEHPERAAELRASVKRLHTLGLVAEAAAPSEGVPDELGEFRLLRKIGEGGMGVVYLAHQQGLQREVALKLIRPDRLGFGVSRERFLREIETIARLSHPGIVQVFAGGEEKGFPYYAMEYLEGSTLEEAIARVAGKQRDGLSGSDLYEALQRDAAPGARTDPAVRSWFSSSWTELSLRIALQVAEALVHAHERQVLHRDVKPSNVMVTRDGRVLLLDFGLALHEDSQRLTRAGAVLGSLPYMAPEQHRSEAIDARTDVYALGVTLYELLTLHSPYLGQGLEDTRRRVLEAAAPPIRQRNPAVPRDVQTVCAKAMDREPERRYASMAAFAADLRNLLELRPIAAEPPTRWVRVKRWSQRRPAAAAALLIAALALGTGGPLFFWNEWRHRQQIEEERDVAVTQRGLAERYRGEAEQERDIAVAQKSRAEAQAGRASAVLEFQRRMFRSVNPGENGRLVKVADVLMLAALDVENGYAGQPEIEAAVRSTLGETFASLSMHEDADRQLDAAQKLLAAIPASEPRDRAQVDFQLGRLRLSESKFDEAEALLTRAHAAYVALDGAESRNAGTVELELAALLRSRGRVPEALAKVAEVCERFERTLGSGERATLDAWGQYGQLLDLEGRFEEAERVLRATIEKKAKIFSAESPDLLVTRINLARVLYARERFQEAYDIAKEVREIQERVLGPDHEHTLVSLSTEATSLSALKDLKGGAALERDLWARRSRVLGPEHPDTLRTAGNFANTLAGLGEDAEAERIARDVLEKRLKVLGPVHWETGASHNHLAGLLQKRQEYTEAREHLLLAVVCAEKLGTDHWIVGAFLNNLGRCEVNLALYDDAARTLERAHGVLSKHFPEEHGRVQSAIKNFVFLYEKSGDEAARARWSAKLKTP